MENMEFGTYRVHFRLNPKKIHELTKRENTLVQGQRGVILGLITYRTIVLEFLIAFYANIASQ